MDRLTIAIVGGGASGALVAAQLLRRGAAQRILLIERSATTGRGIAYATPWADHLLNVPAGKMSALPEDPDHFVRFLSAPPPGIATLGTVADPRTFAPRKVYGDYVEHVLAEAEAGAEAPLERVRDAIVDVEVGADGVVLSGAGGRRYVSDVAVLATGFFPRRRTACCDPWAAGALESLPLDAPLLAIGTGLTMIDVALALEARGFRATLQAISRRGLLPNAHLVSGGASAAANALEPVATADELVRAVRERVAAAGDDWRAAVDGLRPHTQSLWQALPPAEQRRFLRHARPYWDVARHRMAPQIEATVQALLERRTLVVRRMRLVDLRSDGDGVRAALAHPSGLVEERRFAAAIDCTGPNEDYRTVDDPLVAALRVRGLARPHPLGMGWSTAPDGALIDAAGRPSSRLFTLGPPRRGDLLESTAMPEIRVQAAEMAARLQKVGEN
jgi:uncharacterized NAD(P)/FAD-binding protein YdhS